MTPEEFLAARRLLGLTQQQMADAIGVTLRAVKGYEAKNRKTPIPMLAERSARLAIIEAAMRKAKEKKT